ncbi:helicase-related protein [Paeniroseomonas aquatica]|uniref:helicase-related protein n=1 Tax=Paeniroseomonas aquatica TaxID=373043 RepID=UPI003614EE75
MPLLGVSPAEAAILASGIPVEAREMPALIRRVERRMPADAMTIRAALIETRRRGWVSRLNDLANRAGRIWVRRNETEAAAAAIAVLEPDDTTLVEALDAAVASRLRGLGPTPEAALEAIAAEMLEANGSALSADRHAALARDVAAGFGLAGDAEVDFLDRMGAIEARRRRDARDAEAASRAKRREEVQRLRDWERSLVDFRALPGLLGATDKEVLKWIGGGLIPVARRIPARGNGQEKWEFDPSEITALRANIPAWRETDTRETRKRPGNPAAPALKLGRGANAAVARVAALDRYAGHFATARALNRRITLVTGPTNSGKSHTALDRLATSDSGMALAPLRLLAHEFREALASRGVAASLSTGEERMPVPGSRHLAATVEMCPFHNPVDVAMIDEAQMLGDRDRGAAWTAAIMGAPAREVFVLGAPECATLVRRIARLCDDDMDEVKLERKNPLTAARAPVGLGDLRTGDALVAFSRRDVLDLRAELVKRGKRVAVVYGALSPEVRRAEAARFRNGDADVIVATDAIGMGLNLPIRRVVFSTLRKFDGESRRELNSQEVKQIGGRAGRFGQHEEGVVSVLAGGGSPDFIRLMLNAAPGVPEDLRPQVQPDADIVAAVAAEINSDSLFGVLARIKRAVLRTDDPNYRLADMTQAMAVATAVDGVAGLTLLDRWTYALCPVDERDNGVSRLARWAIEHGAGRPVPPPMAGRLPAPERAAREELERAEKVHKRLVAWRWLALRFERAYPERAEAEAETTRLDRWIEDVLRQQRRSKLIA